MFRPEIGHLNKLHRHSSLGDEYYIIEKRDLTGDRDYWYEDLIEQRCPHHNMRYSQINKRDIKLNKKDINTYGSWEF